MNWYKQSQINNLKFRIPLSEMDIKNFSENHPSGQYMIELYDDLGGICVIVVKNNVPDIFKIHSYDSTKVTLNEESKFKRRGFYKMVLSALSQLGFQTFTVYMQSIDNQKALARLVDTEFISNPRSFYGNSTSTIPSKFDLGKQPNIPPKDRWEEEDYKSWLDYKKNYLQKE